MSKPEWIDEMVRGKNQETRILEKNKLKLNKIKFLICQIRDELLYEGIIEDLRGVEGIIVDENELDTYFGYDRFYGNGGFSFIYEGKDGFLTLVDEYNDEVSTTVCGFAESPREVNSGSYSTSICVDISHITEEKIYEMFHFLIKSKFPEGITSRFKFYKKETDGSNSHIFVLTSLFVILLIVGFVGSISF